MHVFRLFGVFVIIPLISVGLCAQDWPKVKASHRKDHTRHLSQVDKSQNATQNQNQPVTFPAINTTPENVTIRLSGPGSISPRSTDSLPTHPHPLHLDVHINKRISNSTSTDNFLQSNLHGEGRGWGSGSGFVVEILNLSWISSLLWKAITSYAIVSVINLVLAPFLKKFGLGGPYWETSINLGNTEDHSVFNFGPNLKKFRLSFGNSQGTKTKDDMKESSSEQGQGQGHGGWGQPQQGNMYPPGHVGYNPQVGPGWLSYDQAAFGVPMMDKYSMKAAKKAAKFTKKAQKYAHKASHYAAKAQAAKLSIKPLYANGFIHPGAATVPGIPSYGWGK